MNFPWLALSWKRIRKLVSRSGNLCPPNAGVRGVIAFRKTGERVELARECPSQRKNLILGTYGLAGQAGEQSVLQLDTKNSAMVARLLTELLCSLKVTLRPLTLMHSCWLPASRIDNVFRDEQVANVVAYFEAWQLLKSLLVIIREVFQFPKRLCCMPAS
ncbi:hypothetical protein QAD02_017397 [Eretmocerus hayati]|uniref:Uncharacterized protein n=1 Tax=Eretmocerus hayati TaxID=131215 RepID=A0ACC2PDU2_9HYME|nr:hypothetical protein QAD02_017397 [Eretmocerus hayati]